MAKLRVSYPVPVGNSPLEIANICVRHFGSLEAAREYCWWKHQYPGPLSNDYGAAYDILCERERRANQETS